jgi:UDP-N-acetyl-D-mannosaminuronate dehydrogenase
MTAHDEFRNLDFKKSKSLMRIPLLIDGRRVYDSEELRKIGFQYYGVGAVNKSL